MAHSLPGLVPLLLSGALSLSAAAPPMPADSRAVLTALLADQRAGTAGDLSHFCFEHALDGPDDIGQPRQDPSVPRPEVDYHWYTMPGRDLRPHPIEPMLAAQLNALLANAPDGAPAGTGAAIDGSMLPSPFRLGPGADCRRTYTLSAPLILGDIAFVERGYSCGGWCGAGDLVALQRREGRWTPIAVADTWIS